MPDYDGYFADLAERAPTPARRLTLGACELANIRYASHGLDVEMIAEARGVSPITVKDQLRKARRKLAAKNTAHAVGIALRLGLID